MKTTDNHIKKLNSDVAIIVPAYNEEKSIRFITKQLLQFSDHIIVVNDGSTDKTVEQLSDLPITLLHNPTNRGKGASLFRGFKHIQSLNIDAIITIDADTQHDPNDIPKFINAMHQYPNHLIIGARLHNKENAPKSRYRANQVADFFISWAAGERIIDTQSGYRLYPMNLLQDCLKNAHHHKFAFESEFLIDSTRQGFSPAAIAIHSHYPEDSRESHYRPFVDTSKIVLMVTWKIVSRGFCLPGLLRILRKREAKLAT